ncbi:MAG TPA: N-acetylmuramoyl-L-alanine amidase [Rhodocyclaceae bacterium]
MRTWLAIAAALLAAACARLPVAPGGVVSVPSPNFDERRPNYVIIHQTSDDTADEALATLTDPERKVSAHYLVGRDGTLYQLVDEAKRAWHAGASWWHGDTDLNSVSIGIELDNNGAEPFAEPQIRRLMALLDDLKQRYKIPTDNFLAHGDVAPGRKVDPSALFPWERLAAAGFGPWCRQAPTNPQAVGDVSLGLRLLGYDTTTPVAALAAFRRHFLGVESSAPPDAKDAAMLNCLLQQERAAE